MLTMIATPIGNLGDISLRAIETMKNADFIVSEDTRHTSKLLNHYEIKKPQISFYEQNQEKVLPRILGLLREGKAIAMVTDAGSPGISDPGYVLVRLPEHPERQPELWHLINNTPGISGFIGSRNTPVPLEDAEVNAIIEEIRGERTRPKPKVKFEVGERVKIIDGPFSNFLGNIDSIDVDRGTLKVMVEIFERLTSVEVEFWQVEKI